MNRRDSLGAIGALAGFGLVSPTEASATSLAPPRTKFRYCLNTSTINVEKTGLKNAIEIAARAGYDDVELWVPDIRKFVAGGGTLFSLRKLIRDSGLGVANAIGFAPWMVSDDKKRSEGFRQMEEEMNLMVELDCKRIAAAPAGMNANDPVDLLKIGGFYKELLVLGRKTGVMPQLEFWGVSPVFYHLGQVLMVAAAANDPDVRILADVFHLFRGGSGFEGMKLINGNFIEVFHMNDFPSTPREEQKDKDRVFPGDGIGPLKEVIQSLKSGGGTKTLSLELFNPDYWAQDTLTVAKTGLAKMRALT